MNDLDRSQLVELTAHIVGAYVEKNPLPAASLPGVIASVSGSIYGLMSGAFLQEAEEAPGEPAVNPRRSVRDDHIVCLEDGKKFKSLRRHLMMAHDLTPAEYRLKWQLPADYPMIAPSYSAARSELAKSLGLGRKPADRNKKAPRGARSG